MHLHQGKTRLVIVRDSDEVIKVPNPNSFVDASRFTITRVMAMLRFAMNGNVNVCKEISGEFSRFLARGPQAVDSFNWLVTSGVDANLTEAMVSYEVAGKELENIIVPTTRTIMGIVNFQKKAEPVPFSNSEIDRLTSEHLGHMSSFGGHTFDHAENFGIYDGRVRLIDYGDRDLYPLFNFPSGIVLNGFDKISKAAGL